MHPSASVRAVAGGDGARRLGPVVLQDLGLDIAVVAAYAAFGTLYVVLEYQRPGPVLSVPIEQTLALAFVASFGLFWWRRAPAVAVAITVIAYGGFIFAALPAATAAGNAVLIALYGAGAFQPSRRATIVRGIAIAVLVVYVSLHLIWNGVGRDLGSVLVLIANALLLNAFIWGAVWLIGDGARARRTYQAALVERTRQLEAERELSAQRAVAEERLRIARELHDVVAHHVSVIGIQAAAARRALLRRPAAAADALRSIEEASRRGIADMQRLLGMLRSQDDQAEAAPKLTDLQGLLTDLRGADLPVRLHVTGPLEDVPPALSMTAYRIVQEALTNVVKHAGPSEVELSIRRGTDELEISVDDNGKGPQPSQRPGKGLIGMRERVAVFGGQLETGTKSGRGYSVYARLPIERS